MDAAKEACAEYVVNRFLKSGMKVGLGTGSTATAFLNSLAVAVKSGRLENIVCVCTSKDTEEKAAKLGLVVRELDDLPPLQPDIEPQMLLDLAVDGADEISYTGHLIKGRGAALFREKFVAQRAIKFIVVAEKTKLVSALGERCHLPVEVVNWSVQTVERSIEAVCQSIVEAPVVTRIRREKENPQYLLTDNGNCIVDVEFPTNKIENPNGLNKVLKGLTGVVETGLFEDKIPTIVLGTEDGTAFEYQIKDY